MDNSMDLRIRKTYMALEKAFIEMMNEMRYEDIRVNELCDRAMIRKSTFYKHFADKSELLAYLVDEALGRYEERIKTDVVNGSPFEYCAQAVSSLFEFVEINIELVRSAVSSKSIRIMMNIISEEVSAHIRKFLEYEHSQGYQLPASISGMASFYSGGITESIRQWLEDGMKRSREEVERDILAIIRCVGEYSECI